MRRGAVWRFRNAATHRCDSLPHRWQNSAWRSHVRITPDHRTRHRTGQTTRFVSGSVQLSLTLTFFSVVFWAVILGPTGALLAIPATLFLRAVLAGASPTAHLGRWLSGEQPPREADTG